MIIYDVITDNVESTFKVADLFTKNFLLSPNNNFPIILHLIGDLGSGKTTFMRGILTSMGFNGGVKSPTYTIVESYNELLFPIYHFDLYRLVDPKELELLGIRDYLQEQAICCFEWPVKGQGFIPDPNFIVNLEFKSENQRKILINKI